MIVLRDVACYWIRFIRGLRIHKRNKVDIDEKKDSTREEEISRKRSERSRKKSMKEGEERVRKDAGLQVKVNVSFKKWNIVGMEWETKRRTKKAREREEELRKMGGCSVKRLDRRILGGKGRRKEKEKKRERERERERDVYKIVCVPPADTRCTVSSVQTNCLVLKEQSQAKYAGQPHRRARLLVRRRSPAAADI